MYRQVTVIKVWKWWIASTFRYKRKDRITEQKKCLRLQLIKVFRAQNCILQRPNRKPKTHHFSGLWLLNKGHDKYTAQAITAFPLAASVYSYCYFNLCFCLFIHFAPVFFFFIYFGCSFPVLTKGERKSRALTFQLLLNPKLLLYKALNYFLLKTNKNVTFKRKEYLIVFWLLTNGPWE